MDCSCAPTSVIVRRIGGNRTDCCWHHNSLDRLLDFKRGTLNQDKADIPTGGDRLRTEAWTLWTLSDTGNWDEYRLDANGDGDYADTATEEVDQNRTHNAVNESTGISEEYQNQPAWADPAYDARGNMTTMPVPVSPATTRTCVYDAWNRLMEVRNGQTVVAQYRYDGLNRRIRKFQPDGGGGTWTVTEYYYNAAWQVLEVHRQGGLSRNGEPLSEPSLATGLLEQYVWSVRYVDAPILRDPPSPPVRGVGRNGRC